MAILDWAKTVSTDALLPLPDTIGKDVSIQKTGERHVFSPLFPLVATLIYYTFLSPSSQLHHVFIPLMAALIALVFWFSRNRNRLEKLHLRTEGIKKALMNGAATGIGLGFFNLFVIVKLTPWLGHSNEFLKKTPHADLPFWTMFPFGILLIGFLIEILFRGWILGRLLIILRRIRGGAWFAVLLSAAYFSFDPFMVAYFKGYHWLALTDGIIWGGLFLKTRNLFSTISAHTVEVWIVYLILKVFYA